MYFPCLYFVGKIVTYTEVNLVNTYTQSLSDTQTRTKYLVLCDKL